MSYYYALFKKTANAVEVEFPDLAGCVTFGKDWEDALIQAEDVLAAWLAHAKNAYIKKPSKHDEIQVTSGELVPITVNKQIIESYQELKRFNVIFPSKILTAVDTFRKKVGLKRSTLLQKAAEEYLARHEIHL